MLTRREMLIVAALSGAALGIGADVSAQPMPCLGPPRPWREVVFSSAPGRIHTPIERVPPAAGLSNAAPTIPATCTACSEGGSAVQAAGMAYMDVAWLLTYLRLRDQPTV